MKINYTQCDICKREAEKQYKLAIEPQTENCNYGNNQIDICEDCLACISNLSIPGMYKDSSIKLSKILKIKNNYKLFAMSN